MLKQFAHATRAALLPLLAVAALALAIASPLTARRAAAQNSNQSGQKPAKKKLGSGSNFQQYAQRDASNRLIAGGATRAVGEEAVTVNQKAQEAYEAGKYDDAIAGFKRLTELKPTSAQAFYHLGVSYETAGKNAEAVEAYKKVLAILDKATMNDDTKMWMAMSLYNMGNILAATERPAEAVEAYKKVMGLLPDQAVIYNNLGLAYAALEQSDDAIASFKRAVEIDPGYAEAHFNLGLAYHVLEDKAGKQAEIKALEDLQAKADEGLKKTDLDESQKSDLEASKKKATDLAAKLKGLKD